FFRRHLGEGLRRAVRLEPRIPSELLPAARLDEHLARALAHEHPRRVAVPVRETALRLRGTVQHRVGDRTEPFAAGRFEEPFDVRPGKMSELVEAERDVLDDEPLVTLR